VIPGFVLAGGASKRMGRDKALLPIQGRTMAERTAGVLAEAGCDPVTLVGRQAQLGALGLPVLRDRAEGYHPLWGVAAALETLTSPFALFAPCDLVQLSATALRRLIAFGGPCVAQGPERVHPLLAVLPRDLAATARSLAEQGAPAHVLVRTLPRVVLPAHVLLDANRPVDLPKPAE
jgi:molybdopterin-guanine dinucleotide biosynthesis protein A